MMIFKDSKGREWTIEVNGWTLKRAREYLKWDPLQLLEGGELQDKFRSDPVMVGDLLWAFCLEQATERKLGEREFATSVGIDRLDEAIGKVLEELVSFSPSPRGREIRGRMLKAIEAASEKVAAKALEQIESGAIERAVDSALATLGASSGSASASPASTGGG